jgi:hypothetical protein
MDKARFAIDGGGPAGRSEAVDAGEAAAEGERATGLLAAASASASAAAAAAAAIVRARLGGGPAGRSEAVDTLAVEPARDKTGAASAAMSGESFGARAAADDGERASRDGGDTRPANGSSGPAGDSAAISMSPARARAGLSDAGLGIRLARIVEHTITAKLRMPIANVHTAIIVMALTKSEHTLFFTEM